MNRSGIHTLPRCTTVVGWLERGLTPAAVRHALTRDLPGDRPIHRPAGFLTHRLTAQLPPRATPFATRGFFGAAG